MEEKLTIIKDETISSLVLNGDLSKLSPVDKVSYYRAFCERLGLDPATQPFKILKLNGREVLYCDRSGAQQLNKLHNVSHQITDRQLIQEAGVYQVTARASSGNRFTESIGAVNITNLKGEAYANAIMKAETKAKRRSTLDLCGLGLLDETEIETIPKAEGVTIEEAAIIPEPKDYETELKQFTTVKDIQEYEKTLTPDQKKEARKLLESAKSKIIAENIETVIDKLQKRTFPNFQLTIEQIIDSETGEEQKKLINLYNSKLETLGLTERYEKRPF